MAVLLLVVLLWAQEALPLIQKVVNQAMKGHISTTGSEISEQMENIIWYKAAFVLFIYSFIDVILVYKGY